MITQNQHQEAILGLLETSPVMLVGAGRGFGKTTAGLLACRKFAQEKKQSVFISNLVEQVAYTYPLTFQDDIGVFGKAFLPRVGAKDSFCLISSGALHDSTVFTHAIDLV